MSSTDRFKPYAPDVPAVVRLEEAVPPEHPVHLFVELVQGVDLSQFVIPRGPKGETPYHPHALPASTCSPASPTTAASCCASARSRSPGWRRWPADPRANHLQPSDGPLRPAPDSPPGSSLRLTPRSTTSTTARLPPAVRALPPLRADP